VPARFFLFRPTRCLKCHGTAIASIVFKAQAVDYTTAGEAMQLVRWRRLLALCLLNGYFCPLQVESSSQVCCL
jgi:hypothetical protein